MVELETTRLAILIMGGCTWFCATYIGPAVSLLRSPFGWRITTTLGVAYLVLLFSLSHVSAQALRLEAARSATHASPPPPALPAVLKELVQPLRW
jgi:threonine/homoserine/homoserine lactone efflux protein